MIGIKIALSGLVVFAFSMWLFGIALKSPENKRLGSAMVILSLISLPAIHIGLLLSIWL